MTKQRVVFMLVLCSSVAVLAVQAFSLPRRPIQAPTTSYIERWWNMTEAERKKELAKMSRPRKLERERRPKESARERAERLARFKYEREQSYKEFQKRVAERKRELLPEKDALRPTEEQWKLIKPKLEKVRRLRGQASSTVGLLLTSSSGSGTKTGSGRSRNEPAFQWRISWKDKPPGELTEAQRIANELMGMVDKNNTTAEDFRRKMAALRKSRLELKKLKRQYAEARRDLRSVLTTRQEAALVLRGWLGCWEDFD